MNTIKNGEIRDGDAVVGRMFKTTDNEGRACYRVEFTRDNDVVGGFFSSRETARAVAAYGSFETLSKWG